MTDETKPDGWCLRRPDGSLSVYSIQERQSAEWVASRRNENEPGHTAVPVRVVPLEDYEALLARVAKLEASRRALADVLVAADDLGPFGGCGGQDAIDDWERRREAALREHGKGE